MNIGYHKIHTYAIIVDHYNLWILLDNGHILRYPKKDESVIGWFNNNFVLL